MWSRFKPVAIAAGLIFLANVIARLLGATVYHKSDDGLTHTGFVFFGVVAVIMIVSAYWWSVRYPSPRALPELGLILLIGCGADVLVGPPVGWAFGKLFGSHMEANPFANGAGVFFAEIWQFMGVGIAGAIVGLLVAMAFGQDYRAKALKRFTETVASRPHRPVRR